MNILTIPSLTGGASHTIPLYVLHQRYFSRMEEVNNSFLLGKAHHKKFIDQQINIVDIDYSIKVKSHLDVNQHSKNSILLKENLAFKKVNPDIIIEDCSFNSPLIAEKNNIPRISIHRTGFFRSIERDLRNKNHIHSFEKGRTGNKEVDISFLFENIKAHKIFQKSTDSDYIKNYLHSKTKFIPGIPSIEKLPDDIPNKESYFYTGPLNVEDNPSEQLQQSINMFFEKTKGLKKVFISIGTIDNNDICELIRCLLKLNYAVISTTSMVLNSEISERFYYNSFLPLNYICSQVDLVVHHCGSGMYHYPILNEKPFITIGTQCYDREDVAQRLQQLNISKHVPHPNDDINYLDIFKECIRAFENKTLCDFIKLTELKNEIYETMLKFNIADAIKYTLS